MPEAACEALSHPSPYKSKNKKNVGRQRHWKRTLRHALIFLFVLTIRTLTRTSTFCSSCRSKATEAEGSLAVFTNQSFINSTMCQKVFISWKCLTEFLQNYPIFLHPNQNISRSILSTLQKYFNNITIFFIAIIKVRQVEIDRITVMYPCSSLASFLTSVLLFRISSFRHASPHYSSGIDGSTPFHTTTTLRRRHGPLRTNHLRSHLFTVELISNGKYVCCRAF